MDFWQAREGCACVTPQDVKSIGMDVLRLRVTSPYEAAIKGSARGWSAQSGWCLRLAGSLSSLVHSAHDASEVCGCHLLKNDSGKLAMAARVRKETTLPIKWIAASLQMGTSKSLKHIPLH